MNLFQTYSGRYDYLTDGKVSYLLNIYLKVSKVPLFFPPNSNPTVWDPYMIFATSTTAVFVEKNFSRMEKFQIECKSHTFFLEKSWCSQNQECQESLNTIVNRTAFNFHISDICEPAFRCNAQSWLIWKWRWQVLHSLKVSLKKQHQS